MYARLCYVLELASEFEHTSKMNIINFHRTCLNALKGGDCCQQADYKRRLACRGHTAVRTNEHRSMFPSRVCVAFSF